ncbi:hypothetical protein Lal_00012070, partial [Lupinus albus]
YFTDLYVSPNDVGPNQLIQSIFPSLVFDEDNTMLTKHPTMDEIKIVVFDMNGEGAPDPDGFGAGPSGLKPPTQVLYADDILIFCKGLKSNLLALNSLIHDYAQASGQHVNLAKCKFYTCSGAARRISNLSAILGFNAGNMPFNYLGVPLFKGKPRRLHLQLILATWKCLSLSIMGRVELVKSHVGLKLPYLCLTIKFDQNTRWLYQKFHLVWGHKTRKIVTVAWKIVCTPTKAGGFGLRSVKHMNQATLLKLSWEMISSEHEWALFCRQRFGREKTSSTRYFKSSI